MIEAVLKELRVKQYQLDEAIYKEHNISKNEILKNKIRAFRTEVCEMENEIEYFKYWKHNKGKGNEAEEYIDGVFFLLSIAELLNYPNREIYPRMVYGNNLGEQLDEVHLTITQYLMTGSFNDWIVLFRLYLGVAEILGYTDEFLVEEYNKKYIKNLNRVKAGY